MKIIADGNAYLQRGDLAFWQDCFGLPKAIVEDLLASGDNPCERTILHSNQDSFVALIHEDAVDALLKASWLFDFNSLELLRESELINFIKQGRAKLSLSPEPVYNTGQVQSCTAEIDSAIVAFQTATLENYLAFRQGKRILHLPHGITSKVAVSPNIVCRFRHLFESI